MANYYSDPTANAAISAVEKEMKRMRKRAERLGTLYRSGRLTPGELRKAGREFKGIYWHLLEEALSPEGEG